MPMNDDPDAFDFPIDDQNPDCDDGFIDPFDYDEEPDPFEEEPIDWDALNDAFGD